MSDIIGIMKEQIEIAEPINYEKVDKAMNELYNGWDKVPSSSKELLNSYLNMFSIATPCYIAQILYSNLYNITL
jgi:hypothetical protein